MVGLSDYSYRKENLFANTEGVLYGFQVGDTERFILRLKILLPEGESEVPIQ